MTFRGKVKDGVVVFESGVKPAEGTIVTVETSKEESVKGPADTLTTGQRLLKFAGIIDDGPTDGSINVDHYLYGHPKK